LAELEQLQWKVKRIETHIEVFSETMKEEVEKSFRFRQQYLDEVGRTQKKLTGGISGFIAIVLALGGLSLRLDIALIIIIPFGIFLLIAFFYYEWKMSKEERYLLKINDSWELSMKDVRTFRSFFVKFTYDLEKMNTAQLEICKIFVECLIGCVRLPIIESYSSALKGTFEEPQKNAFSEHIQIIRSITNSFYPYYLEHREKLQNDKSIMSIIHLLDPYKNFNKSLAS